MSVDPNISAMAPMLGFEVDNNIPVSSSEVLPDFIAPFALSQVTHPAHSLPSHSVSEPPAVFPNQVDHTNGTLPSMHVPTSDLAPSAFMEHSEPLDPAAFAAAVPPAATFIPDYNSVFSAPPPVENGMAIKLPVSSHASSLSPPALSQVPSPEIHGNASSYGAGVTSSLQSALEASVVPGQRSRAGTINSPGASHPVDSLVSPVAPNGTTMVLRYSPPGELPAVKTEGSALSIGGSMLEEIVQSASTAASLCRSDKGAEASKIVDDLREKLAYVSDVISGLKDMSMSESTTTPVFAGANGMPPSLASIPETPPPLSYSVGNAMNSMNMQVHPQLTSRGSPPDQSRKRCASEIGVERPIKALKAEPVDEFPLPPDNMYATPSNMTFTHALQSPPPSRPATPPHSFIFNPVKQSTPIVGYQQYSNPPAPPVDAMTRTSPPSFPPFRSAWSESVVPTRHSHSLSTGSIGVPTARSSVESTLPPKSGGPQPGVTGRMGRSGSIGGSFTHPFSYPYTKPFNDVPPAWSGRQDPCSMIGSSPQWTPGSIVNPSAAVASLETLSNSSANASPEEEGEDADESEDADAPTNGHPHPSSVGSDVPQEYRSEVDRIFFEYLNKICSNLEATDSKGEPIHQTLMPKKMQRLDESPDFRPFKFRILAFTNAFLEELARQGYPEEKIPMKKIRNYLWRHPFIQRFNEDGRKAKSKGNHIWNVEAKKAGEGKWEFRPFHRKLAGTPPGVAYCGLRWHWAPRVWDPQASWQNVPIYYSSPSLPSWLSWKGDELSGTPPPDAQSCDITVMAKFILDGQEGQLSHTFHINVAPRSAMDPSFGRSSIDLSRRASDTTLSQTAARATHRPTPVSENAPARVVEVLQNVAQRVAEEQLSIHPTDDLEGLAKQKHVVENSLVAYDQALTGPTHPETHRLAVAAQAVVAEAAQSAVAPRAAAAGIVSTPLLAIQVASVGEMADLTQEALAAAVKMQGATSNDLDVIETTSSILASRHARVPDNSQSSGAQHMLTPLITAPTRVSLSTNDPYARLPVSSFV